MEPRASRDELACDRRWLAALEVGKCRRQDSQPQQTCCLLCTRDGPEER